ncbi:MAG: glycosyltransferase family 4 protein [Acetobacteraceae bacterium]|nr:glycosyltransferase family 4 protein [Acetobacteraceae bacterium]MBV8588535.1 glycosyltransferase family 4 protein [Acetobacteraceae bacterium]
MVRTTAVLAPRPDQPPPPAGGGLVVTGEISRASGLGEVARLMLRGLEALGVPAWQLDIGTPVSRGEAPAATRPAPAAPLLIHVNAPFLPLALLRLPGGMVRGRRLIGYWAWELPVAPKDWRAGARFVHEAWALSGFTAAALEPLLPGRVRVVTPPFTVAPPVPSRLDRAAFGLPQEAVIVLVSFSLASSFERKNPLGAIRAFRDAFGARADRILVLKVTNPDDFRADYVRLRQAMADAPNIRIETRTLPPADNHALTACADIVLSLHRSEGFGLVAAEAMLLARPVIATAWSGNMDFMNDTSAALVPARLIPAQDPRRVFEAPGAVWAEPDTAMAAAQLRQLADNPDSRIGLGRRGRAYAADRLGLGSLAAAVRALGLGRFHPE